MRGQVIAVAAALQESSLRYANAAVGSFTQPHDRVGPTTTRWGWPAARRWGGRGPDESAASATLFYTALLAVPRTYAHRRRDSSSTVRARRLHVETPADQIVGAVTGADCRQQAAGPPPPTRAPGVTRALRQVEVPYVWGGGARRTTRGGFDCSGLMVYTTSGSA